MVTRRKLDRKGFLGILGAAGLGAAGAGAFLASREDEEPRETSALSSEAMSFASFTSLAEMREECRESDEVAFVAGHTYSGDFGGGLFFRADGDEEDDGGGVYVRLDGSGALFRRMWDGNYVNPAWWGVNNDLSADASPEIAKALEFAYPGSVRMTKGRYLVGSPLVVRGGNTIEGPTARGNTQQHGPGCEFVLADGAGGNVIQSESDPQNELSWHWGGLQHFSIDGNKDNNPAGHGIYVYRMAETSYIREVFIDGCAGSGVYLESTAVPAHIYNVRSGFNDRYGFEVVDTERVLDINGPSGDNNGMGFIRVSSRSPGLSVNIANLKAERRTAEGAGTHDPLITLDNLQGAVVLITGGTATAEPNAGRPADAVVKIVGSPAKVVVQGFTALRYTNLIRDEVAGEVVAMDEMDDSTSDWKHVKHYVYG